MKRRVIQIYHNIDPQGRYLILALCNDGSLWKLHGLYEGTPVWELFQLPPFCRVELDDPIDKLVNAFEKTSKAVIWGFIILAITLAVIVIVK